MHSTEKVINTLQPGLCADNPLPWWEPGLVTFYDIQPGNGAGLFLQAWSPHRALICDKDETS